MLHHHYHLIRYDASGARVGVSALFAVTDTEAARCAGDLAARPGEPAIIELWDGMHLISRIEPSPDATRGWHPHIAF